MGLNTKISADSVLKTLGSLSNKASYLRHLNLAVQALLPEDLAAHCQVANVRDNVLVLHLDGAEWATALHYQVSDLLSQLRQQAAYARLKSIQYKIRPVARRRKIAAVEPAKPLSLKTRKLLEDTAKSVKNKELAEALARLSKS
jgi:hypothetical protein